MSRLLRCCAYYFAFVLVLTFGSNAFAAGYTCPSYKQYTSCNANYYVSDCGSSSNWTGQTISNNNLTTGNSCISCPSGYTCQSSAGLVCPEKSTVTITLNKNSSATNGTSTVYEKYGVGYSLTNFGSTVTSITVPTVTTGYTFRGYYTTQKSDVSSNDSTGTQRITKSGTLPGNTTFAANTTLYAAWAKNCTVPSHGSCTLTVAENGAVTYTTSCNAGYTISGNGTATPTCTANTNTITLNKNGGTGTCGGQSSTTNGSFTCQTGSSSNLPSWNSSSCNITKTNNVFTGWGTTNNATSAVANAFTCPTSNATYYAVWKTPTCNKGTNVSAASLSSVNSSNQPVCSCTCADGYSQSGGTNAITTFTTTGGAGATSVTCTACSARSYTISYALNSGTQASSGVPTSYTYGTGATINGTPRRDGYTFEEWCTDSALTSCAKTQTISTTATGNKTFYAKWSINATVTNPSKTYDGSALTCAGVSGTPSGATIKYGTASGTYNLTSAPTRTDAGTTTVYYQITATNAVTKTGSFSCTVNKANCSITVKDGSTTVASGGTVTLTYPSAKTLTATSSSGATVSFTSGTTANVTVSGKTLTPVKVGTSAITATSAATTNYNACTQTFTASVTAGTITATASNKTLTYNGTTTSNGTAQSCGGGVSVTAPTSGATVTYSTSSTGTYSATAPTLTNVGSTTVYYKVTATNYADKTGSYTCTMGAKAMTVSSSNKTLTYSGSAQSCGGNVTVTTPSSGATVTYSATSDGTYSATAPTLTDAGSTTVYYKVTGANFTEKTGSYTCTMNKANNPIALSANSGSMAYSSTATFTVSNAQGAVTVSSSDTNVATVAISGTTVTITSKAAYGTATITVTAAGNTNYKSGSKTYALTVNKGTISLNNQSATSAGTTAVYQTYNTNVYLDSARSKAMTTSANGITVPAKTGYAFGGYYDTTSYANQYIAANGFITSAGLTAGKALEANGTWYAKWTANTYTVTYKAGTGGSGADTTQSVAYNASFTTKAANTFSKANATFAGWSPSSGSYTKASTQYTYTTVGNVTLTATWNCDAGYTLNSTTGACDPCASGTYKTAAGNGACSACSALTAKPATTDGTYSSVSPFNAATTCRYTAKAKTITGCKTVTNNTVSYNGSSWGTNLYSVTANGGYVIANNNSATATCSQCGAGKYSAGGTETSCGTCANWTYSAAGAASCTSCPTLTSGWSKKDSSGTGWTSVSSCVQVSGTPSNCASGNLKQTATSSTAWGSSAVNSALSANPGYYVNSTACSACGGNNYYCTGGTAARTTVSSGYYSTGGTETTRTGQSQCTGTNYCEGGVSKPCPDATTYKRTTFPTEYYNPVFSRSSVQSANGRSVITQCTALSWYNPGDRAGLYEYVNYNSSSGKYDNTSSWQYMSAQKGYYLTTKGSCGAYAYYTEVKACPAGSYCPGKSEVSCNSSNQATVHTTNFGLEPCPGNYGTSPAGSTEAKQCYLTTSQGKFVAAANAAETTCTAGGYCLGGTKVNYGSTGGRTACSGGTYNASTGSSLASACVTCVTGSYSASGAAACTACQSGKTTSTTGQTSCNATCSNAANVGAWKTATWNTNNTMTNLCTIDSASSSACSAAVKGTGAASATWAVSSNKCVYSGTCSSKYYKPTASGTTVSCTGCPTAYPNSVNGNEYSSDAYCYLTLTKGKQVASAGAGASDCSTGRYCTSTSDIFKGTAGGTATYTGTACQTGSYQDATGQTVCKPCAAGKTNSGTGNTAACTTSCTAISNLSTWATTTWSNGTVGNLCTVDKCAANSYKSGNTCPTCSSGTDSKYTKSAVGTTSVNSCYLTTTAGKYVATAKAGETSCPANSYCAGDTTIYYGTGTQTGGSKTCSSGTSSKYTLSAAGASKVGQCYLTLTAGKQVASAGAGATDCSAGRYCTSTSNIYYNTDGGTATYTGTQCVAGSYSEAGASSCVACGAGKTSTAGATSLSACTSCSAITNLSTWASSTWNTNNTMSNLCTVGNCATNSYKSGNTCPTCSSGTDSKYTKSAAGTTSVNSCYLTTEAGKYVATAKAGQVACPADSYCVGGTTIYYGTGTTTGGSASCSALSGVSVAGGTYSSVSPRSASSNCRYTAPAPTVPTYCATKTSNTVSYSGTAWPTSTYAVTAKAGSVISGNNTKDATCSQCGAGKFSAGGTETSCGSCPAAETGWTMSAAAGLSAVTQCTETTTPATSGSPIATICTAGTLTKKATSTTAWGNATASGLTAKAGRYVNGTTCSACAAGTYTSAASTATSCTAADKGYYVSGTEQTAQSACAAGTYTSSTGQSNCTDAAAGTYTTGCQITASNTACTGTSVCANNTWSGAKASSCTACTTAKGYGNSGTTAAAHNGIASCKVTCGGGKYVATAGAGCVDVGIGYWGAGGTVAENATLARNQCAAGLTTIGTGAGADEAADCGRVLNFNGQKIYLRSEKRTTPSLNISINGTTFYGNMTEGTSKGSLRINSGGTVYSVHDDSM